MTSLLTAVVVITVMSVNFSTAADSASPSATAPTGSDHELPLHQQELFHILGENLPVMPALLLSLTSKEVRACMGDVADRALYHHVFISDQYDPDFYVQFRRLCQRLDHSPTLRASFDAVSEVHLVRCIDRLPKLDVGQFAFIAPSAFRDAFAGLYGNVKFGRDRRFYLNRDYLHTHPDGDDSQWNAVCGAGLSRLLPGDVPVVVRDRIAERCSATSDDIVAIFASANAFVLLLRRDVLFGLMQFGGWRLELRDLLVRGDVPEPDLADVFPLLDTFWDINGQPKLEAFLRTVHGFLVEGGPPRLPSVWRLTLVVDHVRAQWRCLLRSGQDLYATFADLIETRYPLLAELLTCQYDDAGDTFLHRICREDGDGRLMTMLLQSSSGAGDDQFDPLKSLDVSVRNAAGRVPFQYAPPGMLHEVQRRNPELWDRVRHSFPGSADVLAHVHPSRAAPDRGAAIWAGVVQALPEIVAFARRRRPPPLPELSAEAKLHLDRFTGKLRADTRCRTDTVLASAWTSVEFDTGDGRRQSLAHGNTIVHYLFASKAAADVLPDLYDLRRGRGLASGRLLVANGDGRLPWSYISDTVLLDVLRGERGRRFVRVLIDVDPGLFISAARRLLLTNDPDAVTVISAARNLLFICADRIPFLSHPAALAVAPPSSEAEASTRHSASLTAVDLIEGRTSPAASAAANDDDDAACKSDSAEPNGDCHRGAVGHSAVSDSVPDDSGHSCGSLGFWLIWGLCISAVSAVMIMASYVVICDRHQALAAYSRTSHINVPVYDQ